MVKYYKFTVQKLKEIQLFNNYAVHETTGKSASYSYCHVKYTCGHSTWDNQVPMWMGLEAVGYWGFNFLGIMSYKLEWESQ